MSGVCVVSVGDDGFGYLFDAATRSLLHTLKSTPKGVADRALLAVGSSDDPFGVAIGEASRPTVHTRPWAAAVVKSSTADRLLCMAASASRELVVGGGTSGNAFAWEAASGANLGSWKPHYRAVTCAAFTDCDTVLFTGGADAVIHAWLVADLIGSWHTEGAPRPAPLKTLAGHTLPVNHMWVGFGGTAARLVSSSTDRSVKVWGLHSAHPVVSFEAPCAVNVSVCDAIEAAVFMGAADGTIYEAGLHAAAVRDVPVATIGGQGGGEGAVRALRGHSRAVTDLKMAGDGVYMVSASEDHSVRVWDVAARQVVGVFGNHVAPVRALLLIPKPTIGGGSRKSDATAGIAVPFRKHPTPKATLAETPIPLRVIGDPDTVSTAHPALPSTVTAPPAAAHGSGAGVEVGATKKALMEEVAALKAENERWKAVNNRLLAAAGLAGAPQAARPPEPEPELEPVPVAAPPAAAPRPKKGRKGRSRKRQRGPAAK